MHHGTVRQIGCNGDMQLEKLGSRTGQHTSLGDAKVLASNTQHDMHVSVIKLVDFS